MIRSANQRCHEPHRFTSSMFSFPLRVQADTSRGKVGVRVVRLLRADKHEVLFNAHAFR